MPAPTHPFTVRERLSIALGHLNSAQVAESLTQGADPNTLDSQGRSGLRQVFVALEHAQVNDACARIKIGGEIEASLLRAGANPNEGWPRDAEGQAGPALATVVAQAFTLVSVQLSSAPAQIDRIAHWMAHGANPNQSTGNLTTYDQWLDEVMSHAGINDHFDPGVEPLAIGVWQALKTVPVADATLARWCDHYVGLPLDALWIAEQRARDLAQAPVASVRRRRQRS